MAVITDDFFRHIDDFFSDYAVYAMTYQLGLRVGEVHELNLTSLDLKNKKVSVKRE